MDVHEPHTKGSESSARGGMRQACTPADAEGVLARVRAEHGLGQRYAREVWYRGDGRWIIVAPSGEQTVVEPMSRTAFRRWLEGVYFIEAIAEHDATTEG